MLTCFVVLCCLLLVSVSMLFSPYVRTDTIIIIIISIFKEDKVFSMSASLPYGPPVNTDIDYYRIFFGLFL